MNEPDYPGPYPDEDPDSDFEQFADWLDREEAAGRAPAPAPSALDEAAPDGPGPLFEQGGAADRLAPGPPLAELTEAAVADAGRLNDDQLIGAMHAVRRQQNREGWKKSLLIAEFAQRRAAELEQAEANGAPVHRRPGQFPGEELAMELLLGPVHASYAIEDATDLVTRLPQTLAGMRAGLIDEDRAGVIARYTRSLSAADAALADRILAALAPSLRIDQLARKAAALEIKLAPEAVKARRAHARRTSQRVEIRHEDSGNASVAGREMDIGDALVAKAHLHALALRLRRAGLPGTLDQLRLRVFADLVAGRDPLRRADRPGAQDQAPAGPGASAPPGAGLDYPHDELDLEEHAGSGPAGGPAGTGWPVPAMINLIVPAGTLFGWGTAPADAGGWGPLDAEETRDLVAAASRHPATRWCVTLTRPDGTATAHGCAAGRHRWRPPPERSAAWTQSGQPRGPTADQAGQLARFLSGLSLTLRPVARGRCDHTTAEAGYTPSRVLSHLVRARTVTCDAPGCAAQAVHSDLDHTVPYPAGPTDQCNLGPKCRRHHRVKQAPGWRVDQPEPGVVRWTLPSGRVHTTTPTRYDH